jgi:hypothetical protein
MNPSPKVAPKVKPGRSAWDAVLLLATAAGVIFVLALVTAAFARLVLNSPWAHRIPPSLLALMTFLGILGTMLLCFLAFFRGRRDARKSILPHPEHAVVRTLVAKVDDRGRPVNPGAVGTIVQVHPTAASESPAYAIEVVVTDKLGKQVDASLFDARHEELEVVRSSKLSPDPPHPAPREEGPGQ